MHPDSCPSLARSVRQWQRKRAPRDVSSRTLVLSRGPRWVTARRDEDQSFVTRAEIKESIQGKTSKCRGTEGSMKETAVIKGMTA